MVRGRAARLERVCRRTGGVWRLFLTDPAGPALTYSPPSHHSYGAPPARPDPYETAAVRVGPSTHPGNHSILCTNRCRYCKLYCTAGARDGLFSVRPILAGEVVAFYSGLVIHCDSSLRALDRRELSDEEEHERNMYVDI